MRPDVEAATERAVAMCARLARTSERSALAEDVEDVLCDGYAQALAGDAWLAERERRLHDLIEEPSIEFRAHDLRALIGEHRDFQHGVIALRFELEALRREHHRLRARSHAGSA